MKSWIVENLGKTITGISLVVALVSFLIGAYIQQQLLGKDIDSLKNQIKGLRSQIREIKDDDLWYIKQWISNPSNYR